MWVTPLLCPTWKSSIWSGSYAEDFSHREAKLPLASATAFACYNMLQPGRPPQGSSWAVHLRSPVGHSVPPASPPTSWKLFIKTAPLMFYYFLCSGQYEMMNTIWNRWCCEKKQPHPTKYLLYLITKLKANLPNKWQIMITSFGLSVTYLDRRERGGM